MVQNQPRPKVAVSSFDGLSLSKEGMAVAAWLSRRSAKSLKARFFIPFRTESDGESSRSEEPQKSVNFQPERLFLKHQIAQGHQLRSSLNSNQRRPPAMTLISRVWNSLMGGTPKTGAAKSETESAPKAEQYAGAPKDSFSFGGVIKSPLMAEMEQ